MGTHIVKRQIQWMKKKRILFIVWWFENIVLMHTHKKCHGLVCLLLLLPATSIVFCSICSHKLCLEFSITKKQRTTKRNNVTIRNLVFVGALIYHFDYVYHTIFQWFKISSQFLRFISEVKVKEQKLFFVSVINVNVNVHAHAVFIFGFLFSRSHNTLEPAW